MGYKLDGFSCQFYRIFEIIIVCFVLDICDLVHDVESIFYLHRKDFQMLLAVNRGYV